MNPLNRKTLIILAACLISAAACLTAYCWPDRHPLEGPCTVTTDPEYRYGFAEVPAATIVEVLGLCSAPYYSAYLKAPSSRLMAEIRLPQSGEIGYTPLDDFGSKNAAVLKKKYDPLRVRRP